MQPLSITQFADRMNEVMPVLMKEFVKYQVKELQGGKITLQQFLILETLQTHEQLKMKDLAKTMQVTTAAMTGIIDRLVRDGYVSRLSDDSDRRIIWIHNTKQARILVNKINDQRRSMTMRLFEKISDQDRESYLRILTQIKDMLLTQSNQSV